MEFIHFLLILILIIGTLNEDCSNLNGEYGCNGDQTVYPESWDERIFQTPPRDDIEGNYRPTYQDMHYLMGYAQLKYSQDKNTCTVTFITKVNPILGKENENYKIFYTFGDIEQESNTITLTNENSFPNGMPISAKIIDRDGSYTIAKLELEDEYFMWDNPIVNQGPQYENGQKGAIVEFFGWPYDDIAEECEFLETAGYMAAKIFPPSESILTFDTVENGELNPWYFIYQPVSYRLKSRMGDKKQLKNMINICRKHNIRIYTDAVINHMAGNGNDMYSDHRNSMGGSCIHWGPKAGSAGSPWWTTGWQYQNNTYTGLKPGLEFPSVPYFPSDFHCERSLNSWTDANILNTGWLTGLTDLNTGKDYVRQRIADYITGLLSMGVSGIRIDAAKHVHPTDLAQIFKKLKDNLGGGELPDDFTAYLEVLFGGEKDLLLCGDGDYSYGIPFVNKMKSAGLIDPKRHAIGLDCHDDQNQGSSSRDMGDKGSVYIKEKNIQTHRHFNVEMFTRTDVEWKIKLLMTSYSFMNNGAAGFPDGNSDCNRCTGEQCKKNCSKSVPYQKAYNPSSTGYDTGDGGNWKEGSYTRVHRDREIINAMRKWMGLESLNDEQLFSKERLKAKHI
jgi:alpha-amylase